MESEKLIKLQRLVELTALFKGSLDIPFHITQELYHLNNYLMPAHMHEHSIGCSSCQTRVRNRIFEWSELHSKKEIEDLTNQINNNNDTTSITPQA